MEQWASTFIILARVHHNGNYPGKTALALSFMTDRMPTDYTPTVSDRFSVDIKVGDELITLDVMDTAGQDEFKQ